MILLIKSNLEPLNPSRFNCATTNDRHNYVNFSNCFLFLFYSRNSGNCEHRHIERCSWPQCSHSCPRLLDPYTGEEVNFIDMLKSFGLRMDSVAQALGVDLHTLNNMEHTELLDLLTQQIN